METNDQVKLRFHGVDIFKADFTSFAEFKNSSIELGLAVDAKVYFPEENKKIFKILMEIRVSADEFFTIFVGAIGTFELNVELGEEVIKKQLVNVNAPAIMFPYIRSFITTLTSNLGNSTGPIIIPVKFFQGDLQEFKRDEREEDKTKRMITP